MAAVAELPSRYAVETADAAGMLEAQRLRYRIFAEELGALLPHAAESLDRDEYDPHCTHLLVRERGTGRIVACTRVLDDASARAAGGFYSGTEFDLTRVLALRGRYMEIGRTCVDPAYRNGAVIATLWQGIGRLVGSHGADYLFGCASIAFRDDPAHARAILRQLRERHLAPEPRRVRPLHPLPEGTGAPLDLVPRMPALLRTYVSLGAKACGEPCWDPEFGVADVLMLLDLRELDSRFARHFLPGVSAMGARVAYA